MVSAIAGLALLLFASSASATFHLTKIREISPGTNGDDNSYVEVQMYAPFQNYLSNGATVVTCNNICSIVPKVFSGFSNVANGNSQDTVVFGDDGVPPASRDFNVDLNLDQNEAGGAVCYVSEPGYSDCVSWGNFTANDTLTANYDSSANPGTPAPALTSGMALRRSISAGCPTALDGGADDTNNSAADFAVTAPDPRPNSVTPSEMTCGSTAPPTGAPTQPGGAGAKKKKNCKKKKRSSGNGSAGTGTGTGNPPAYAAKKKSCKKKKRK